jgi:ATP-dependent RNA helicase DHX8/PRP22
MDSRRSRKRLTSPERWEAKQLIASGVLKVEDYPDFDDETGQGVLHAELEAEEEYEIDINEDEPLFLRGQSSKTGVEVPPVLLPLHSSAPILLLSICYKDYLNLAGKAFWCNR